MSRAPGERALTVVGGGPVGALAGIFLARRGFEVVVHERRADPRAAGADSGRSINLVITSRGIHALARVGLWEAAGRLTVPVRGRVMHALDGTLTAQPYGRDDSECNHSIPRLALNRFLIDEAERCGVRFRFASRLVAADVRAGRLTFVDEAAARTIEVEAEVVLGADGAGSTLRAEMVRRGACVQHTAPLGHGYKELSIPAGPGRSFRIEAGALHIWPRGRLMLMALPNADGSFTVTLYLPDAGGESFASIADEAGVLALFRRHFPDAVELIDDLPRAFLANPTGSLATVRCSPWTAAGRALLVGDAAHAIVPFFGQGMNCGFEDCTVLDSLLANPTTRWPSLIAEFDRLRKPDADAIAEMALDNFVEMRDRVGDPAFLMRKEIERRLERAFPHEYRSRYALVVFGRIPYAVAQEAGRIQREILDEIAVGLGDAAAVDLDRAGSLIRERLTPYLAGKGVAIDA